MSGRTRVTLADGRRVTGFRKTLRRNRRLPEPTEGDETLPVSLSFIAPDDWLLSPGPAGISGVTVCALDRVTVEGYGLEFVCRQASEFIRNVATGSTVQLRFSVRRGRWQASGEAIYVPGASVIWPRATQDALVFP